MAKSETIQRPEKGTELFDTSEKVFPDVQAEPGESAYTFMHTVPYEGSVGLVNLLTTTRVLRKGFKTHLILYGPGVLMASGTPRLPEGRRRGVPGPHGDQQPAARRSSTRAAPCTPAGSPRARCTASRRTC